ncbi:hypothetical protein SAMN05192551_10337 [Tindallia magadiensis]|uniref:Uncharacterized protein n=1 Tax=Tindallia magadiensis TaxID=69895 RepID=A0A1I3CVD8_9FIRM|nr:hypothetical protein SAMN05192551_10337 [Tindallia magadiensis]
MISTFVDIIHGFSYAFRGDERLFIRKLNKCVFVALSKNY